MPRGSKPGERRGGRQRGTPNKSTLLKHAAFEAAATDPNLSPLDFLLKLMRQVDLPLELRVTVAQQALPFTHPKPKPDKPIKLKTVKGTYGDSRNGVNEKIGPRVEVVKVNADDAYSDNVTPLDFLLGVMRDVDSPAALRLRVIGIVAPYVHRKGEPIEAGEPPVAMVVVEDPYGFDTDVGDKLETINRDRERLHVLPRLSDVKSSHEFYAALEKAKQTNLELAKSVDEKLAALRCPPTYKELDSRKDRARLKELEAESAWICTRNDVLGNLAVLLAALGVLGTGTGWPDVFVAAIMASLALQGAVLVIRQARIELQVSRRLRTHRRFA
jgi:hypothetical protein